MYSSKTYAYVTTLHISLWDWSELMAFPSCHFMWCQARKWMLVSTIFYVNSMCWERQETPINEYYELLSTRPLDIQITAWILYILIGIDILIYNIKQAGRSDNRTHSIHAHEEYLFFILRLNNNNCLSGRRSNCLSGWKNNCLSGRRSNYCLSGWRNNYSLSGWKSNSLSGWRSNYCLSGWRSNNCLSGWRRNYCLSGWRSNCLSGWRRNYCLSGWRSNCLSGWRSNFLSGWKNK